MKNYLRKDWSALLFTNYWTKMALTPLNKGLTSSVEHVLLVSYLRWTAETGLNPDIVESEWKKEIRSPFRAYRSGVNVFLMASVTPLGTIWVGGSNRSAPCLRTPAVYCLATGLWNSKNPRTTPTNNLTISPHHPGLKCTWRERSQRKGQRSPSPSAQCHQGRSIDRTVSTPFLLGWGIPDLYLYVWIQFLRHKII